jgi:hypothetical protein
MAAEAGAGIEAEQPREYPRANLIQLNDTCLDSFQSLAGHQFGIA